MTPDEARAHLEGLHPTQIALGLDCIREVLARLGSPERSAPALHVAGTNGKGSVCAMAECALRAAGHRTGFYSSPHLVRFEERIRIDGVPIGGEALAASVAAVRDADQGLDSTYFEFGTAVAFHAFRAAAVDVQVLETGLGGRLDATNVVTPVAAAITALGLDHQRILGDTLAEIAFEKAGILKPGLTCAVASPPAEAAPVLAARAAAAGATLWVEGRDFALEGEVYRGPSLTLSGVRPALLGPHQHQNAAVALALLEIASHALTFPEATLLRGVPEAALVRGVNEARWPGRLQLLRFDGVELALDGAHNEPAAQALAAAVGQLWPGRPVTLIFGVLEDKELEPMARALFPLAHRLILTQPQSPRARAPETYLAMAQTLAKDVVVELSPRAALEKAARDAAAGELVLVCGSLYLVGEVLKVAGDVK